MSSETWIEKLILIVIGFSLSEVVRKKAFTNECTLDSLDYMSIMIITTSAILLSIYIFNNRSGFTKRILEKKNRLAVSFIIISTIFYTFAYLGKYQLLKTIPVSKYVLLSGSLVAICVLLLSKLLVNEPISKYKKYGLIFYIIASYCFYKSN